MVICQNVSKYYEHICLKNFLSLFMSLLAPFIVKKSHILAGIYFIFLKKCRRPNLNTKFGRQWKDHERNYGVRQSLALFCILVALIWDWKSAKGLRITKLPNKSNLKESGASQKKKTFCRDNHSQNTWDELQCLCETAHCMKSSIYFFSSFFPILTKFNVWRETGH